MSVNRKYQHWRTNIDDENILWLYFDRQDASANTFNTEVFAELTAIIAEIKKNKKYRGVIIRSGKPGGIAGADITEFTKFDTTEDAVHFIKTGQSVFNELAEISIPTVALIQGYWLGGGCELALACRYRIAEEHEKTQIGLPEIQLGIQPGWGGSVRLPKLIGVLNAMSIILPGKSVDARTAAKIHLVDVSVPTRHLDDAAIQFVLTQPKPHEASFWQNILAEKFMRPVVGQFLTRELQKKHVNKDHYPAPYAVIKNWVEVDDYSEKAFARELQSIAQLILTPTAVSLTHLFFLRERLKNYGKLSKSTVAHVHVVGAGVMGGDIAAWCALRGLKVTLQDTRDQAIADAFKRAHALFKKRLKSSREVTNAIDRLIPDKNGNFVVHADVVIEAIFENLPAKQNLFKELEQKVKPETILATNTSSIPLHEISQALTQPSRLVGIHFFNPVAKMMLVEVVANGNTDSEVVKQAQAFVGKIGMLPLPVASHPGFLVNRILMPYLVEAMTLYSEGIPGQLIDRAAVSFGMPLGPIELADRVGLDICLAVAQILVSDQSIIPEFLKDKVKNGELGAKTGKGFYEYKEGKLQKSPLVNAQQGTKMDAQDIIDRLIYRMLLEAAYCLKDKVVEDANLVDAGLVFGAGFAPFRGGLMTYAKSIGPHQLTERFQYLASQYGERFNNNIDWSKLLAD